MDLPATASSDAAPRASAVSRRLLVAGLLSGAIAAAAGLLLDSRAPPLPPGAVAMVNRHPILRDEWLRAVAAVASERRAELTDAEQRHILDRLIDEELLVQHGIALGLAEHDPRIRSELVSEVMLSAAATGEPDDAGLRRFYDDNRDFFEPAPKLRVAAWRLDADGARREFQPGVPDALLPAAKLETYLGPAATAAAIALTAGATSPPIASGGARIQLQLLERRAEPPPPFEQVRARALAEYRRRADEAAVRALLTQLRADVRVVVETR